MSQQSLFPHPFPEVWCCFMNELLRKKKWPEYRQTEREWRKEGGREDWKYCNLRDIAVLWKEEVPNHMIHFCCGCLLLNDLCCALGHIMNDYTCCMFRCNQTKAGDLLCLSRCSRYNHHDDPIISSTGAVAVTASPPHDVTVCQGNRG